MKCKKTSWVRKVEKCITTLAEMERYKNFLTELHVHSALTFDVGRFIEFMQIYCTNHSMGPKKM